MRSAAVGKALSRPHAVNQRQKFAGAARKSKGGIVKNYGGSVSPKADKAGYQGMCCDNFRVTSYKSLH